jgi:hypothetical protein
VQPALEVAFLIAMRGLWLASISAALVSARTDASPPSISLADIRERLELHKNRATARCARSFPIPSTVSVVAGVSTVTAADEDDAFAACFASEVAANMCTGWCTDPGSGLFVLKLATPKQLVDHAIASSFEYGDCLPRPGAIPRTVTIDISSDDTDVTVHATTSPSNAAVAECYADNVRDAFDEAGIGVELKPSAHLAHPVAPHVTSARLRLALPDIASDAAASCDRPDIPETANKMRIVVTAKRDADSFGVVARSSDAKRDACTTRAIVEGLHQRFEVQLEDGTRYFRIDSNASASLAFEIESAPQLESRRAAEQRARRRR